MLEHIDQVFVPAVAAPLQLLIFVVALLDKGCLAIHHISSHPCNYLTDNSTLAYTKLILELAGSLAHDFNMTVRSQELLASVALLDERLLDIN